MRDFFRYECRDLIKACWWSGSPVENCCDGSESIMTDYGKCIRLPNSNFNRRQWLSGTDHGMELLIDMKISERVGSIKFKKWKFYFISDDSYENFSEFGVRLLLHESHEFPILSSYGISVPTGKKLYAGMEFRNVR